jgi:hypothetical protein
LLDQLEDNVDDVNDKVEAYVKTSFQYYKLDFYKKSMKSVISLSRLILIFVSALIALFFLSFAAALLISEATGNDSYGFFYVGGFYLLLMILIVIFGRKPLEKMLLKSTSKNFFND